MSAPLSFSSGASVAQKLCATAEFAPKINLAAQKRATAPSAVEQQRSKLDFSIRAIPPQRLHAATQHIMEGMIP